MAVQRVVIIERRVRVKVTASFHPYAGQDSPHASGPEIPTPHANWEEKKGQPSRLDQCLWPRVRPDNNPNEDGYDPSGHSELHHPIRVDVSRIGAAAKNDHRSNR